MYKIFADDTLIYDSTLEDYKIGQGAVTLEVDKAGSFVFSVYPDHFYYDHFVQLKTVITVYKHDRIVFRGRVLDDAVDYWNNKVLTCEGELSFLQDSIIRPYNFSGNPKEFFRWLIDNHNAQVDDFKHFQIGEVTVVDPNGYIARSNSSYENTMENMTSRLLEDATGGHIYITHGPDDTDPIPTIHYLADFWKKATQPIEFGVNLRDYTKTVKSEDVATAIIPLGAPVDDGNSDTEDPKLTIAEVNDGRDYVYSEKGVELYGWVFKTVEWEDVTDPANLKAKAEEYVESVINQALTLELTAVDMNLLDRSIESYNVCEYVPVISAPHKINAVLLCNKQTMDLRNPANDSVVLGHTVATFTERTAQNAAGMAALKVLTGRVGKILNVLHESTTSIEDVVTRIDALYASAYSLVTIEVEDTGNAVKDLLETKGTLQAGGQKITTVPAKIAVSGGSCAVAYTLVESLGKARKVYVNDLEIGTVSTVDDNVATVLSVVDGDTITIKFEE